MRGLINKYLNNCMKQFLLGGILLFFGILSARSQEIAISGRVVAAKDGSELPGVNIQIKNTTLGTITKVDGTYNLNVRSTRDTLVFSFIGFVAKEAIVGNRTVIDVGLDAETTELEEVVVTGFQEVERKL